MTQLTASLGIAFSLLLGSGCHMSGAKQVEKTEATHAAAHGEAAPVAPDVALARLKAGNDRFAAAVQTAGQPVKAERAATAQAQHPFAIVVSCADSRVGPELVFDQGVGELFVVRAAGNLVDDYGLGSIEYAVEHLGARLIVVIGHERCGAVKAALAASSAPGHVNALVRDIQPAVQASKSRPGDALANAVRENAVEVAAKIKAEAKLGELTGQVKVVVGIYDLDTGKVDWVQQ
jgi:carbonic anhydrase